MTPERWRAVNHVLQSALDLPPDERSEYVRQACAGDESLRVEVDSLIAAYGHAGSFLEHSESLAGGTLGNYRIVERIGRGGMGEVYLALDNRLGRRVALKVLPRQFSADAERLRRFEREARSASALSDPHIVTVYEIGEADSTRFIASEFVEGETLRARLVRDPPGLEEAVGIFRQLISALRAAHNAGVVHRDVKPENIIIRTDGVVKVLDFGLAKLTDARAVTPESITDLRTREGLIVGTTHYMSPEQIRGAGIDHRTDLWSAGIVLYELVCRRRPFEGSTTADVLTAILHDEPQMAEIPAGLRTVVMKALQKDLKLRYQSAGDLLAEVETVSRPRRVIPWRSAVAAIALAAIVTAGIFIMGRQQRPVAAQPTPIRSVAVLPFSSISADRESDYFADGMTEELISALAQLPDIKVVARTSAFAFKGSKEDVREIAKKLGVAAVVEGSVRTDGRKLRVTAQLVNAADGYDLWSKSFDREMTDIFAVQDEIATAVATALQSRAQGRSLVGRRTKSLEAYELYLKGRQASLVSTSESLGDAITSFRRAIEHDPAFSDAWAGLADTYAFMDHGVGSPLMSPEQSYRLAEDAASRALALDPDCAEAHAALGHILVHLGRYDDAERHARRAVEINPNSAWARMWYGWLLSGRGRTKEMKEQFLRARQLDPYSKFICRTAMVNLLSAGDYPAAADFAQQLIRVSPDDGEAHTALALPYMYQGRFAEAEEELRRAIASPRPDSRVAVPIFQAQLLALSGRKTEALALIGRLEREGKDLPEREVLRVYATAGDLDSAARWLERMVRRSPLRARADSRLPSHAAFDAFRADSRYRRIRADLGGLGEWKEP